MMKWFSSALAASSNNAIQSSPANNLTQSSRNVTFNWRNRPRATAGYQLLIWKAPGDSGYNIHSPTSPSSINGRMLNYQMSAGSTSRRVNVPANFGRKIRWAVLGCANFTGKGRRCSLGYGGNYLNFSGNSGDGSSISFNQHILPAFKHARCINCHAVAVGGLRSGVGMPANHEPATAATNGNSCHINSMLPTQGNINPGWKSAPANMDFRNKSNAQLCTMAKNPGGHASTAAQHLREDKLVLWAIGKAQVPGKNLAMAPSYNIYTWRNQVQQWADAGYPCN